MLSRNMRARVFCAAVLLIPGYRATVGAQAQQIPTVRLGPLAPAVDSVAGRSEVSGSASCRTGTRWRNLGGGTQIGCFLSAGDTLFYYYTVPSGLVTGWGRNWKSGPKNFDSTAKQLASALSAQFGPAELCNGGGRVSNFMIWRKSDSFLVLYTDPKADALGLPMDTYLVSRLGTPTCTFRDWLGPPIPEH